MLPVVFVEQIMELCESAVFDITALKNTHSPTEITAPSLFLLTNIITTSMMMASRDTDSCFR